MNFPNLIPILHIDLLKYLMAVNLNNKYGCKLDIIEIRFTRFIRKVSLISPRVFIPRVYIKVMCNRV